MSEAVRRAIVNYTRLKRGRGTIRVEVLKVRWLDSYTPEGSWHLSERLPEGSRLSEIRAACQRAVRHTTYFAQCHTCHSILIQGHMHSPGLCQGCATRYHGVVY